MRAERGDVIEQAALSIRRQIDQQALSDPCRRLCRIKPAVSQGCRPVVAKIDRHRSPVGRGSGPKIGEDSGFELDDLWLVDLEYYRIRRPRQPVGPGIEARSEDHRLPNARRSGTGQEV